MEKFTYDGTLIWLTVFSDFVGLYSVSGRAVAMNDSPAKCARGKWRRETSEDVSSG